MDKTHDFPKTLPLSRKNFKKKFMDGEVIDVGLVIDGLATDGMIDDRWVVADDWL